MNFNLLIARVLRKYFNFCEWDYKLFGIVGNEKTTLRATIAEIYPVGGYSYPIIKPKTIIDLGSNIGVSVKYFKKEFGDDVKVICVEPNNYNLVYLKKNIADCWNVFVLNNLIASMKGFGSRIDVSECTTSYSYKINDEGVVRAITMNDIITNFALTSVDLVKIDIEGAEYDLLLNNNKWLDISRDLFIEFHGANESLLDESFKLLFKKGFFLRGTSSGICWFSKYKSNLVCGALHVNSELHVN